MSSLLLSDGRIVPCDAALFSIGVLANTEIAKAAGLKIGHRIKVNDMMESSEADIYAAGDSCEVDDDYWFGLWLISMKQGRVAGTNAAGGHATFIKETPPYMVNTMKTRIISQGFLPDEAGDNIRFEDKKDAENYSYERLVYRDDDLVGFVLIGNAAKKIISLQKELKK